MAVNADWMPTLAELCGINLDTDDLDGKSLVPVIQDNSLESRHADGFCWQNGKSWASRSGSWKLLGHPVIPGQTLAPADSLFLVNLDDDPGEMENLSQRFPERVKELQELYARWLENNP